MWHDHQVRSYKYRNWVKAGLGLKYLGNGLAPFVDESVKKQHHGILEDIERTHGARTKCDQCNVETLMPIHTSGQKNRCPLGHKPFCNCKSPRGKVLCPTRFCSALYDKLIIQHRYFSPNWKNTDITNWFDNHWQIAKTFIPAGGYGHRTTVQDTDCSGLLNIIINNNAMYSLLDTVIDAPNDIFSKTRKVRDDIFHSSSFELEDDQFTAMIDNMTAILEDKKQLKHIPEAIEAKNNLLRLRNEDFVITLQDEGEIRKTAMDAIDEMKTQALTAIGDKQQQVLDEIQACSLQQTTATVAIERRLEGTEQTLHTVQQKQTDLETSIESLRDSHSQLQRDVKDIGQELANLKSDELYSKAKAEHRERLKYIEDKQALQQDLVRVYKKFYSNISVHPLMQERDEVFIEEMYVKPALRIMQSKHTRQGNAKVDITSYKDIFWSEQLRHQNIYITGDAGIGKSAFCKQLINAWCKVHEQSRQRDESNMLAGNDFFEIYQELKTFEFLFFVSLRHSKHETHVHEMIKNQLLQTRRYNDLFERIVEEDSEKCLIVLDGLDEWRENQEAATPKRNPMAKYTVLTTSRPWRIETARLKNTEVDVNIELYGMDSSAADDMAGKIINYLNTTFKRSKEVSCFEREILMKDLTQLKRVPILLQQMVCVWHDNESLGESQCSIYSSMLNLLIRIAERKHNLVPLSASNDTSDILPSCLRDNSHCRTHLRLVLSLAKIAFETLFSQPDPVLVFPSPQIEICGMSATEINQSLSIGILTQNEATGFSAVTRYKNIEFVHKTFQEFLAALHIATRCTPNASEIHADVSNVILDTVFEKCITINEVLAFSMVFKFLFGMNPDVGKKVSVHIQSVIIDQRNRANTLLPASTCSKGLHSSVCGRLMGENNEGISRMNSLFLDWVHEARKCGHSNTQVVCPEITDYEMYRYVAPKQVKAVSFFWVDLSLFRLLDKYPYGSLTSLHVSDCYSVELMKYTIFNLILRSKHTLTTLHLDLGELTSWSNRRRRNNILKLMKILKQLVSLHNLALTNITCEHDFLEEISDYLPTLSNLTSVYFENMLGPEICERHLGACSTIDLSNRDSKINHIHTIASRIVLDNFTYDRVQTLCVDENAMERIRDNLKRCKNLGVFTFIPTYRQFHVPYGMYFNDFNIISAISSAIPCLKSLVHVQISLVNLRNHNLVLSQEMKCLSTLQFSNILIKERSLNELFRTIPCKNNMAVNCKELFSVCTDDLHVGTLKMNFDGEQDDTVKYTGIQKLSTATQSLVTQLCDNRILIALSIVRKNFRTAVSSSANWCEISL